MPAQDTGGLDSHRGECVLWTQGFHCIAMAALLS